MKSLASDDLYMAFGEYASDVAREYAIDMTTDKTAEKIAVVFDIGGFIAKHGIGNIDRFAEDLLKLKKEKYLFYSLEANVNGDGEFYVMIIIHNPNLMA